MGSNHSGLRSLMDRGEVQRRIGKERFENMKKYFDMLAFPERTIDKNQFRRVVLRDCAPEHVVEAIYDLIASDSGLCFDALAIALTIFTTGTVEERSKFLQILLALDVPAGLGKNIGYERLSMVIPGDERKAAALTKVIYRNRSEIMRDDRHERLKGLVLSSEKLAWLLTENSAYLQPHLMDLYSVLAKKTKLSHPEILFMETKYMQLTEKSFYKFSLQSFQDVISPPVNYYLSQALFEVLDQNSDGEVDFVDLVVGCSECCRGTEDQQANFLLRFLRGNKTMFDRAQLVKECERIFNSKMELLADPSNDVSKVCEALKENDTPRLILTYLQQVFHLFFGIRWTTRESERQNIKNWLATNGNCALKEGQWWYAIDKSWYDRWQGVKHKRQANVLVRRGSLLLQQLHISGKTNPKHSTVRSEETGYDEESPIDNTHLVDLKIAWIQQKLDIEPEHQLKSQEEIREGLDYLFLPYPVWAYFRRTYGGGPILPRVVIRNEHGILQIDAYKIVMKLFGDMELINNAKPFKYKLLSSRGMSLPNENSALIVPAVSNINRDKFARSKMSEDLVHVLIFSRHDRCQKVLDEASKVLGLQMKDFRLWLKKPDGSSFSIQSNPSIRLRDLDIPDYCRVYVDVRRDNGQWSYTSLSKKKTENGQTLDHMSGLDNLGNTCYINSVLQCLSHSTPLREFLLSQSCEKLLKSKSKMKGNLAGAYRKLLKEMFKKKIPVLSTFEIREILGKTCTRFRSEYEQQDTMEFLQFVLDCLHQDLIQPEDNPASVDQSSMTTGEKFWENYVRGNHSIVTDLFMGLLRSTITCRKCGYCSSSFEPCNVLPIPIPQGDEIIISVRVVFCTSPRSLKTIQLPVNESLTLWTVRSLMENRLNGGEIVFFNWQKNYFEIAEYDNIGIKNVNFDNIIAYQLEGPPSAEPAKMKDLLVVYQRRVTERPLSFSSIDRYRVDNIGVPFVFRRSTLNTLRQLRNKIEQAVKPLLKDVPDKVQLFQVCRVTVDGKLCSKCHWSRFCLGCAVDCDDELVSKELAGCAAAIEYELQIAHQHYDFALATAFHRQEESREAHEMLVYRSLDECLERFFEEETIDDKIVCPSCGGEQLFTQATTIVKIPKILIIQLNRVENHFGRLEKACQAIDFPIDDTLFCVKEKEDSGYSLSTSKPADEAASCYRYQLYAVICHYGSISYGHYVAYVRLHDSKRSDWAMYDDTYYKIVTKSEIDFLKENCYVLFYKLI